MSRARRHNPRLQQGDACCVFNAVHGANIEPTSIQTYSADDIAGSLAESGSQEAARCATAPFRGKQLWIW
jgi:hypothetical protein